MKELLAVACAAWTVAVATQAGAAQPSEPTKEVVIDGLASPWSIAFLSESQALVTEKQGDLLRVDLEAGKATRVPGVPADRIRETVEGTPGDNSGLFDVVLHPNFAENRWLYLSYAARKGDTRGLKVVRGELSSGGLTDVRTIAKVSPYTANEYHHYGGGLAFGADGKLYITAGERVFRESDEPPVPIAQDVTDLRGKVLRLNDDGSVPEDNPDFGVEGAPGLYALGLRAAQGIARHPRTGALWFSEHGSRQGDEINVLARGANYGWPVRTAGTYRDRDYVPPAINSDGLTFTAPAWSFVQTVAPTGLSFYFGRDFPEWTGDLLVPGLSRGSLWRLHVDGTRVVSATALFAEDRVRARKVAVSPGGTLYLLTDTVFTVSDDGALQYTGAPDGQLIRIVPGVDSR
ncbi:MAG: PQQ-dependent sugar dehydrogenase [Pseudomonadota bacterium]